MITAFIHLAEAEKGDKYYGYGGSTMSFEDEYRALMAKPVEEIKEDIFFRMDNFQDEPWYGDFQMYLTVGVCQPSEEHALQVRKAL